MAKKGQKISKKWSLHAFIQQLINIGIYCHSWELFIDETYTHVENILDVIEEEILNPTTKNVKPQMSPLCGLVPLDEEEVESTDEKLK
jgi:hypothetical protein